LAIKEHASSITYTGVMPKPTDGKWLAFFIEFEFESIENSNMKVTTEANVVPEIYPYDDCTLDACYGSLV
jgi:hypothetical protein